MDYSSLTGASIPDMRGSARNAASCLGSQSGVMLSPRGRLKYRDRFRDKHGHSLMMWWLDSVCSRQNLHIASVVPCTSLSCFLLKSWPVIARTILLRCSRLNFIILRDLLRSIRGKRSLVCLQSFLADHFRFHSSLISWFTCESISALLMCVSRVVWSFVPSFASKSAISFP